MKVVINGCFGGFSISKRAAEFMAARGNVTAKAELAEDGEFYGYGYSGGNDGYDRTDPDLVAAVEELGVSASGSCAELRVVAIPDGIEWEISDYDGLESVEECHRSWC